MKKKTSLKKVNRLHNKFITCQQVIDFIMYSISYQCNWMIELLQTLKGQKIAKEETGKDNTAIGAAPTSANSNTENVHKPKEGMVRKTPFYLYLVEFYTG